MAVYVTFFTPSGLGSSNAPTVGKMRARESVSVGATSTGATQDGEAIYVFNNEATAVYVATGSTPVATATSATNATTAGVVIGPSAFMAIVTNTGDKIAVAAVS